jgi:solute carrier family 25 (mitochondrial S-adenosylmethionine transporter), member 26
VDVALFPIDTIKTRLQSERGFWRSGGFRGIYKGLGATATGSTPTAALFFFTYESIKSFLMQRTTKDQTPFVHMLAASCGEVVACLIRVPVEIAKQRKQAMLVRTETSSLQILYQAFRQEGVRKGIYRGFGITIMREVPFSLIQFPLWEYLKVQWQPTTGLPLNPISVAVCGAISGGIAAGLTTPLDVLKTRIMLAESSRPTSAPRILMSIYRENGIRGLFAGFVPRVLWITLGGAIFFGVYDLMTNALNDRDQHVRR